ncbi:hypothetical protein GCM10023261_04540 [Bartonella jaculi]|uniref:Uncharacterized protein n=1 Tax=Bartonella jaculi TaxID=686226 RepID=A0ABP9N5P6_9HYPH
MTVTYRKALCGIFNHKDFGEYKGRLARIYGTKGDRSDFYVGYNNEKSGAIY